MKNLNDISCTVRPMAACQSVLKALLLVHNAGDRLTTGIITVGHHLPCVYPLSA